RPVARAGGRGTARNRHAAGRPSGNPVGGGAGPPPPVAQRRHAPQEQKLPRDTRRTGRAPGRRGGRRQAARRPAHGLRRAPHRREADLDLDEGPSHAGRGDRDRGDRGDRGGRHGRDRDRGGRGDRRDRGDRGDRGGRGFGDRRPRHGGGRPGSERPRPLIQDI